MNWRELIKHQMQLAGVTQEQLAEDLEMTQGGLGHWLNGKRQPPFEKLIAIADRLGMDRAVLGAALLNAQVGGAHEMAKEPPIKQRAPKSQISGNQEVDFDLLQTILDGQNDIREDFKTILAEIRAAKGAPAKAPKKAAK